MPLDPSFFQNVCVLPLLIHDNDPSRDIILPMDFPITPPSLSLPILDLLDFVMSENMRALMVLS